MEYTSTKNVYSNSNRLSLTPEHRTIHCQPTTTDVGQVEGIAIVQLFFGFNGKRLTNKTN